jgi:hypothetical protein
VAVAAFMILTWCGVGQGRLLESHTHSDGSLTMTTAMYESRWPLWLTILLLATAGIGVLLVALPRREKPIN